MSRAVIKAGQERIVSQGYCSFDLRDISRQAASILNDAKIEAVRIVAEARTQAAAIRQEESTDARRGGYQEGLIQGREDGRAAGLAESRERFKTEQAALLSTLTDLARQFDAKRERLYLEARQDVLVLGIAIAARICRKFTDAEELSLPAASQACQDALAMLSDATQVVIRAHPGDAAAIERFCEDWSRAVKSSRHARIVEDSSIGRGGVIIESAESAVDATIGSRIERIADELVAGWREQMKKRSIQL